MAAQWELATLTNLACTPTLTTAPSTTSARMASNILEIAQLDFTSAQVYSCATGLMLLAAVETEAVSVIGVTKREKTTEFV